MRLFCAKLIVSVLTLLPFGLGQAAGAPLDAVAFTDHYVAAITEALPGATLTSTAPLRMSLKTEAGQIGEIFLENPFADYCADPAALDDIVATHIASIVASLERHAALGNEIDLNAVLPMVRALDWIEARAHQVRRAGGDRGSETFHEPFAGPFVVVYAMDLPQTIQYLRHADVERLGLAPDALRHRAMLNLTRRAAEITADMIEGGNVVLFEFGDDLASSLLLIDKIWSTDAIRFEGEFVVAVPDRGTLLVTSSENPAGLAQMREISARVMAGNTYRLSDTLLVHRDGRFEVFDGAPSPAQ